MNETTRWKSFDDAAVGIGGRKALRSESYVTQALPHLLGTFDMTALFLLNVYWINNVPSMVSAGPVSFLYWMMTGLAFFIPCSLVMGLLARLFPTVGGGIYAWTYAALGPRWSFFVGICAWLPGILSLLTASIVLVSCIQALNAHWLIEVWQQGIVILVVLSFVGMLSCQRTRTVQNILNVATSGMLLATFLLSIAALVWISTGHASATNFADTSGWHLSFLGPQANSALLGSATLSLFGSDMPLCLAGEARKSGALTRHLWWGTALTLGGYLLSTFALLVVQGAGVAANTVNPMLLPIITVEKVFGKGVGDFMALCLLLYFLLIPVALNVCFARIPLSAAVDGRIPVWFAHLNRHRVPVNTLFAQILIAAFFTVIFYFLVPALTFLGKPADLSSEAYNVIGAGLLLVWAISFAFPFIDAVVLSMRARKSFLRFSILSRLIMVVSVVTGPLLCLAAIVFTLENSFIPGLIPNSAWGVLIGGVAVISLTACGIGTMLTTSQADWEQMRDSALS